MIYLRISVNRTSEHASITQQRTDCATLADRLGYTHTIEFVDEAISAYRDRVRPAYQQLLRHLENAETGSVIVWHLDRLYRKPRELEQLLDLLDTRPIRIESVQGGSFDLNLHEGRLFARQLVAFANYEPAHKGARVARAQQQRAAYGRLHGGNHYGYRADGTLHEPQAQTLRRIVDNYLIGFSPTGIARTLNAESVPPPRTSQWRATTIRAILESDRIHHRRHDRSAQQQITGSWERLLAPEESALIDTTLLLPRRDAARSSRSLLGGILRCPKCDQRMVVGVTRHGKRVYTCRTATIRCPTPSTDADLLDAETEAATLYAFTHTPRTDPPCAHDLLTRVRAARARLTALANSFGTGCINHTSFLNQRQPLVQELDRAEHDVTLHHRSRILTLDPTDFHQRWASLPFRRAAIHALLPRISA